MDATTCDKTQLIHRYHDGELTPAERQVVEAHVAECRSCRELLADLKRLTGFIRTASLVDMPQEAMPAIPRLRRTASDAGVLRIASWMTATAAAVLVAAILSAPADRLERSDQPASWETVAVTPPSELQGEPANSDLVVLAQWMADDLTFKRDGELR